MSDLADQIDDYICTFDGVGDLTMDTLAMFIFGWGLLALFLLWLCKFLYNKYVKKDGPTVSVDSTKFGISPSEKIRRSESKEISTSKDIKVCMIENLFNKKNMKFNEEILIEATSVFLILIKNNNIFHMCECRV